jgi:rhodanese-related sulfurtransferase
MKKTISTEKLQSLRKGREGFLLVDVLGKEAFAKDHIPGARNVPLDTEDFAKAVADKVAGSKSKRVVLYCGGLDCDASSKAVKLLVEGGFTNVSEYEGGLASWNESKRARLARAAKPAS